MVSVQERLKLKRAQIDTWAIREQLCLASSVVRSGDQNWMSVSRSLKSFANPGRPPDWFSQKSCAVQYSNLLENVETPKRKKRTDKGDTSVETPSESIVRRLTQERIDELKRLMFEDRQKYAKLKEDVMLIKSGNADDKLPDMGQEIEEEKKQKERKAEAHERWLKEREEKKVELERAWKPPVTSASPHRRKHHPKIHRRNSSQSEPSSEAEMDSPLNEPLNVDVIGEETVQEPVVEPEPSPTPTSPLLTSLLKSPSPAPVSQGSSILHSAITSHRGASPTITSLLSSAPGMPGASQMVSVAPPTTVSSSLKNLVSSAISSEQPHHQPPPHNPSPAAGAPTLSMLLELPPSLPGKPLPELPSAAKTTTLPPSTVSAIVSAASTPTTSSRVVAVGAGMSPVSSKIMSSVADSGSNEVHASQEVKIADSTSKDDDIEVLQVDSTENCVESQQLPIETKEELIEEVLIEEVVVNDDSVIESELLASHISDVVVAPEQEATKKPEKNGEEMKLDEPSIEASQSTEVVTQKDDLKSDMVADIDSTSNNSELLVNAESTNVSIPEEKKEECIEDIIDTSSEEPVSEIVTEETAAVEEVPASETELTSGAVAEVIEITDDQETTIQTEVVDECGPCMQELEDMEVIILDKVQGLDEVQIVEDMKELECEVVEVVMDSQEKIDDEIKEDTGELLHDSPKPEEEITEEETCSLETDTVIECKSSEDAENISTCKSDVSSTEQQENLDIKSENIENDEVLNNDIPCVEDAEEEDKLENIPDIESAENGYEIEDSAGPREIIVERSSVEEIIEEIADDNDNDMNKVEEQEPEELCKDIHQNVPVHSSETSLNLEADGEINDQELELEDNNSLRTDSCETEKKDALEEDLKECDVISEDSGLQDSLLKHSSVKESEKESLKINISSGDEKEDSAEESAKMNVINEDLQEDKKDPSSVKKEGLQELSTEKDISNESSKKDLKEKVTEDELSEDDEKKDLQAKEQKESLTSEKCNIKTEDSIVEGLLKEESVTDTSKRELLKINENTKRIVKESVKNVEEKVSVKEKEISKKESTRKKTPLPVKDLEKNLEDKEVKKEAFSKDSSKNEVQVSLSKDSVKKDTQVEMETKKPVPSKEFPKRDLVSSKKEILTSRKDQVSKKESSSAKKDSMVKEGPKENQTKRESLRRDSKEDNSRKEIVKRNQVKEERKELHKDDMKKKSKEMTKTTRKVDVDIKNNDAKPEIGIRAERTKRDDEAIKEESKETKKERIVKENPQKGEEDKNKDVFTSKEPKSVSSTKMKSALEEGNKTTMEKKDVKEHHKMSEMTGKQETVENTIEPEKEKPEKRPHLRSETPFMEDEKTNDAEPSKIVGRKRLAAVNVMDSVPNSPASTTDEEREYKSWKKSIMLLYGRLATHKYASLFLRPITDDQAPGYSSVVHRPIDLLTIKKNIETGVIRTTTEFQRDVMLMFINSIMYNKSSHLVHKMAKQMQQEGMQHIQDYLTTQMLVQVVGDGVPIRRETRTTEANKQRDMLGNPSNVTNMDENEGSPMHKRKRNTASDYSERGLKKKKVDE